MGDPGSNCWWAIRNEAGEDDDAGEAENFFLLQSNRQDLLLDKRRRENERNKGEGTRGIQLMRRCFAS
jgi:hypothetical protein